MQLNLFSFSKGEALFVDAAAWDAEVLQGASDRSHERFRSAQVDAHGLHVHPLQLRRAHEQLIEARKDI
jgi:hypothetical protein